MSAVGGGGLAFDPIERAGQLWDRRWPAADAMMVVTSVMRVHQLLLARLDALVRPYGLTFARYEALVLLHFSRTGALPLGKIGQRLMVHPTSATNTIDRLAAQGLVRRVVNPADGRGRLAEITAAGREVVEQVTADLTADRFGLAGVPPAALRAALHALQDIRRAAGDLPAAPSSNWVCPYCAGHAVPK